MTYSGASNVGDLCIRMIVSPNDLQGQSQLTKKHTNTVNKDIHRTCQFKMFNWYYLTNPIV